MLEVEHLRFAPKGCHDQLYATMSVTIMRANPEEEDSYVPWCDPSYYSPVVAPFLPLGPHGHACLCFKWARYCVALCWAQHFPCIQIMITNQEFSSRTYAP